MNNGHKDISTLDDIRDEYILCRDLGHAWQVFDVRISGKLDEIHRVLRCRQCPTLKTQVLSLDGYIRRSHYTYPPGYVLPGIGRLHVEDRAQIRVLSTNVMKRS